MKEIVFQLFWCAESNYQTIFAFGWWEDLHTINNKCFGHLNHDFVIAVKQVALKLVSIV